MTWLAALWLASTAAAAPRATADSVVLRTAFGDVTLELYADTTPRHAARILELARSGAYDSTPIFRVRRGSLIQIASVRGRRLPLTVDQEKALGPLAPEFGGARHRRYSLSMGRFPHDLNSAESSFSIMLEDAPHLDGQYTVFGRVSAGEDVLRAIESVEVDAESRPRHWFEVTKAEVLPAGAAAPPTPGRVLRPGSQLPDVLPYLLVAMMVIGALTGLGHGEFFDRWARAMMLLNVLLGYFGLILLTLPAVKARGLLGLGLFVAGLAVFRALNQFERPS